MYKRFDAIQSAMIPEYLHLFPGMVELVSKLKAIGIPLGILTNRITPSLFQHLNHFNMAHLFSVCISTYLMCYLSNVSIFLHLTNVRLQNPANNVWSTS